MKWFLFYFDVCGVCVVDFRDVRCLVGYCEIENERSIVNGFIM